MKKAILAVSFGTSYESALRNSIEKLEEDFEKAYPDFEIRRAFTSGTIIRKLKKRGIIIDTVQEAMHRLEDEGFYEVIVQPTHLIDGFEYDRLCAAVNKYEGGIPNLRIGIPLLRTKHDIERVCELLEKNFDSSYAVAVMGHGTEHNANCTYEKFGEVCRKKGIKNIFIGTVDARPDINDIIMKLKENGFSRVVLTPLLLVAGDHANNDMAGDEQDSWKSVLEAEGFEVETVIKGLGEYEEIRALYIEHLRDTIDNRGYRRQKAIRFLIEKQQKLQRLPQKSDFSIKELGYVKSAFGPLPRALEAAGLKEISPMYLEKQKRRAERRRNAKKRGSENA